jgi:hypothetical protein
VTFRNLPTGRSKSAVQLITDQYSNEQCEHPNITQHDNSPEKFSSGAKIQSLVGILGLESIYFMGLFQWQKHGMLRLDGRYSKVNQALIRALLKTVLTVDKMRHSFLQK